MLLWLPGLCRQRTHLPAKCVECRLHGALREINQLWSRRLPLKKGVPPSLRSLVRSCSPKYSRMRGCVSSCPGLDGSSAARSPALLNLGRIARHSNGRGPNHFILSLFTAGRRAKRGVCPPRAKGSDRHWVNDRGGRPANYILGPV